MFNKTIKNIMSKYIPYETIICDDRDPPWINKDIKVQILIKIMLTNLTFTMRNLCSSLINFSLFKQGWAL